MSDPLKPFGVSTDVPSLLSAARSKVPLVASIEDLLTTLAAALPNGPLAALPAHQKAALNANGVALPNGIAAQAQQAMIVQLSQKKDTLGELGSAEQLRLQQAMTRQSQFMQMLSNILKAQNDTANNVIKNIR